MGFHAPGLDPHPSKCFASRPLTHGRNLPLCKFEPMWTCTTCTADQTGLPLSLASSEPPTSFSAFSFCGASVTLDADWIVLCSICSCPVLRLLSPLPLGGGGGCATEEPKKKKKKWGEMCAPSDPLRYLGAPMSVLRSTPILFLVSPTPMPSKKKKGGGRMTTHASYIRYAAFDGYGRSYCYFLAVLYLLIEMDWVLPWVLLVDFCVACFWFAFFLIQPSLYSGS